MNRAIVEVMTRSQGLWEQSFSRRRPRALRAPKSFPRYEGRERRCPQSAWIRGPPTITEETASRLHLVERGENNVRVSPASCVEWSDARELVVMVCERRPRRVLKLRSRKPDAVIKLSIHHSPLLFTSQTHVCSDTGAAHDQRRHTPWCSDGICANTQKLCHLKTGSLVTGQLHQTRPHTNNSSTWS